MAAYDLEEQEQLEELKTWWKQYGTLVTAVVTVAALALIGWQGWNWWQRDINSQASSMFSALQQAAVQKDAKRTKELGGSLIAKFPGTAYASMGVLISAKVQLDAADTKNARAQLEWLIANGSDDELKEIARVRLAAVLLDEGGYDDALKVLAVAPATEMQIRHAEVTGDVYAAQGKRSESLDWYDKALAQLTVGEQSGDADAKRRAANYREVLRAKRDALGGGIIEAAAK